MKNLSFAANRFLNIRFFIVLIFLFLISSCDDGNLGVVSTPSSGVAVSGTLDSNVLSNVAQNSVDYAVGNAQPTKIIAIPVSEDGISIEMFVNPRQAVISNDGSFSLLLENTTDWILLVVNENVSDKADKILGYIAIDSGSETIVKMPITKAVDSLDLGDLVFDDSGTFEFTTVNSINELLNGLNLTDSELARLSRLDDAIKQIGNVYLNYDQSTAVYYMPNFEFRWWMNGETENPIRNAYSDVSIYDYSGYTSNFETNDPGLPGWEPVYNHDFIFRLYPPDEVVGAANEIDGTHIWDETNPMDTSGALIKENNGPDTIGLRDYHHAILNFSPGLTGLQLMYDLIGEPPSGFWDLGIYTTSTGAYSSLAKFNFNIVRPIDEAGIS